MTLKELKKQITDMEESIEKYGVDDFEVKIHAYTQNGIERLTLEDKLSFDIGEKVFWLAARE